MLLVYSHKITPRLKYIFKHICTRILGIPVIFSNKVEDFIAHKSLKMSYTNQPLANEFFIRSHKMLFEQGLSDLDINVSDWDDTKCFFSTSEKSFLPFDIFAASFYLISRYEEYLPHVKDDYGRYVVTESLAYNNKFLKKPVVDIWAYKFKSAIQDKFPEFKFPSRKYYVQPIIDVPISHNYKLKGIMRTIGGTIRDLFTFKFSHLYQRYAVLFGFVKDPYNTFSYIINKQKHHLNKFIVFFLIADYSTYDKNININKREFQSLIKSVGDYCTVGLKASFLALHDDLLLKKEKSVMESIINTDLKVTRFSHNKINLPESYRRLIDLEISEDYSMGYLNNVGFRAGTCTPFLFYDLDYEIQTPLRVCPFQVIDFALLTKVSLLDKKQELLKIIGEVKKVGGTFTAIFHNYTFSNDIRWKGFKELFNLILESEHEVE